MIPNWTENGVIPPINDLNPTGLERSPYLVSLIDVVLKYGTSPKRNKILLGLLNFRKELHKIGITKGFQWIDGSFLEDVETLEKREPNDVDIVNFYYLPENISSQRELILKNSHLFDRNITKYDFNVDSFFVEISLDSNEISAEVLVQKTHYWYSIWSHKRDLSWKGFLQIDLSPSDDENALGNLNTNNISLVKEELK